MALRSKGSWGYDAAFLEACRAELTLTAEKIERHPTFVVEDGGSPAGFYTLEPLSPDAVELGLLYVEPQCQGRGLGRVLMDHACAEARARGFCTLEIQSDPNAEAFYRAMGAVRIGTRPSGSIPGRTLPLLRLDLETPASSKVPLAKRLIAGTAVVVTLLLSSCAPLPRTAADPPHDGRSTAPEHVVLSSTEPGSASDLRRLALWLGDAQIVGLGENVHGAHELHRLAHRIFAHLVQEEGFSVFALEVDAGHGMLINDFVQGEHDDLDSILAGRWWASAPFYDQALRDLLVWMRDHNQTANEPIHFAGFDAKQAQLAVDMLQRELHSRDPAAAAELGERFADVERIGHLGVFPNVLGYSGSLDIKLPSTASAASRNLRVSLRLRGADVTFGTVGFHLSTAGLPAQATTIAGSALVAERTLEGSIQLPPGTEAATLTVFHRGGGTVWFDDLRLELDDATMTQTPLLAEAKVAPLMMPDFQTMDYTADAESGGSALRVTCDARLAVAISSADRIAEIVRQYLDGHPRDSASADLRQLAHVVIQATKWRTLAETNRDVFLANNLEWLADSRYPGKRILALAHTSHSERVPNRMGAFLADRRGTTYRTVSMLAQGGAYRYFPSPSRVPTGLLPETEAIELTPQQLRPLARALGLRTETNAIFQLRPGTELQDPRGMSIDLNRAPDVAIVVRAVTPARPLRRQVPDR